MTHNFVPIHYDHWQDGNLRYAIKWCSVCGLVKTGPFSEPGAYNYFFYYVVGSEKPLEGKEEPPCKPSATEIPIQQSP